ncbi:hypothetical protein SDC9_143360 [bioreactor metagenome]|uniref:Uncharacterized protein n=1 Tax=bioreactor metagenome TaxID=1076179 RepID=A0A645E6L7_9ZZZZ
MIEKYNVTVDIFISELAKVIFEILTEYTGSSQSLIQEIINAEELSDDIKSIVSQLKLERIEESQNWKKFTNENLDEIENPIELIKVPLAELRIKQIDIEYQELQGKIFLDDTKILIRMRELLDEKKLINETDLRYE